MSDEGQERTQEPTQHRRDEARKQGQVPYSPDLAGSTVLLAGVVGLYFWGPGMANAFLGLVRERAMRGVPADLGPAEVGELLGGLLVFFFHQVGPFLALVVAAGVAASVVQVGFAITPERLGPNFDRLDPAAGFSRVFSVAGVVKGLLAIARIAVLAVVIVVVLRSRAGVFSATNQGDVATAAALAWQLTMRVALYLSGVFFLIGVIDFAYQRYRFEQSLRMTRQELKEEMKREEGDPLVKMRLRQLGREMAKRRMVDEVPKATVVVTNPTHFAVAIRYDRGTMKAPKVVAKGAGAFARRIADLGRRHGIPVVERPALARALYRGVGVDREVPPAFFVAVAEVVAFVYRLSGRA